MKTGIVMAVLASWYLVGLSVTVGLVIYPSFRIVNAEGWLQFHQHHSQRISYAVGLPWLVQAIGLSIWLIVDPGSTWIAWIVAAVAALATVVLTIIGAVPSHNRLSEARTDDELHRLLVLHWIRTAAWIVAAVAATAALVQTY